jgi:hypothetical protein
MKKTYRWPRLRYVPKPVEIKQEELEIGRKINNVEAIISINPEQGSLTTLAILGRPEQEMLRPQYFYKRVGENLWMEEKGKSSLVEFSDYQKILNELGDKLK